MKTKRNLTIWIIILLIIIILLVFIIKSINNKKLDNSNNLFLEKQNIDFTSLSQKDE